MGTIARGVMPSLSVDAAENDYTSSQRLSEIRKLRVRAKSYPLGVDCISSSISKITPNKSKRAAPIQADEDLPCCPQLTKKPASTLNAPESFIKSPQKHSTRIPDLLDSMDCSSGESLGFEQTSVLPSNDKVSEQHKNFENSSFTSSRLAKLRLSDLDNPQAVFAMLSSRQSPLEPPEFPIGTTIGNEALEDGDSMDTSEITMQTLKELGMVSETINGKSLVARPRCYTSNLCDNKFFDPKDTCISAATQIARSKCLDILKGPRPALRINDPSSDEESTSDVTRRHQQGLTSEAMDSPPSVQVPHTSLRNRQDIVTSKRPPTIIQVTHLPEASTTDNILFEYEGKVFQHAPLPSGWEIRVSKSKNRPFYVHPERGATWYCPVVNPIVAMKSSHIDFISEPRSNSLNEETDDFDCVATDSNTSANRSLMSLTSGTEISIENASITDSVNTLEPQNEKASALASHTKENISSNVVLRAVTAEVGDLVVCSTDSTMRKGASTKLPDEADSSECETHEECHSPESINSRSYDCHMLDSSPEKSQSDAIKMKMTSPDEEIASLVLVNLAQRRTRNIRGTVALYDCDRIDSQTQLATRIETNGLSSSSTTPIGEESKTASTMHDVPVKVHDFTPKRLEQAADMNGFSETLGQHKFLNERIDVETRGASLDSVGSCATKDGALPDDIECDFPSADDVHFQPTPASNNCNDEDSLAPKNYNNKLAIDAVTESDSMPFNDVSMICINNASNTSKDKGNKSQAQYCKGDTHDFAVTGEAHSVFHPKVVETNGDCSVSTLGGCHYRDSFMEATLWSTMSSRIANPPHPVCALQNLDRIGLKVVPTRNTSKVQASLRPKPRTTFAGGPPRQLHFLSCR